MRIAVVAGVFPKWSETFVLDQVTYALEQGIDVDIIASEPADGPSHPSPHDDTLRRQTRYYARTHPGLSWGRRRLSAWSKLLGHPRLTLRALRSGCSRQQVEDVSAFLPVRDYDVVHCHFAPQAVRVLPALVAGALRGQLLTTFHGYDVLKAQAEDYRELFSSRSFYTANTRFLKERAVALGCPGDRLTLLPMGVNQAFLQEGGLRESSTQLEPGPRLVTVARLVEFKGVEFGLRALAQLLPEYPQVTYDIVGDGPLRSQLETLARELKLSHCVRFHGALDRTKTKALLRQAMAFVMPGIVDQQGQCEAQGVVLGEAQALGIPVVASSVGGIPEAVCPDSAILVPPGAPDELAMALATLLASPDRRRDMGEAGRRFVLERFDQHKLNQRLLQIYEALASGRGVNGL